MLFKNTKKFPREMKMTQCLIVVHNQQSYSRKVSAALGGKRAGGNLHDFGQPGGTEDIPTFLEKMF